MTYLLIVIYTMAIPGYQSYGDQIIPVRLGEFKTYEACAAAGKEIGPRLRKGSFVLCAPTNSVPR